MRLCAVDLACHRGGRDVFSGLGFAVASGEALTITGRNGAGKSSLLRILAGLLPVYEGEMLWRNEETGASITLIKFEKGTGIPQVHLHASNQLMYCLSGKYRYVPSGLTLTPGVFYCNPKGNVHGPAVALEETIVIEVYDGPHYPFKPDFYANEQDAR